MTPETPDPPPVSPDPWKAVDAHRAFILFTTERPAVYDLCAEVDAARAADALRHQQALAAKDHEIAGLKADIAFKDSLIWTGRESECYKATVAAEKEAKALRAALSVVDAQVHQQAELLAQRWDTVERLTKQHNEWKAQAEQHAAHLRERDAQIARLSTQVEDAEQWYRVTYTSLCDQAAQAVTLRAERDAAQQTLERCREVQQTTAEAWRIEHEEMTQQIATLTPYKAAFDELYATVQGECPSLLDPCRGGSDVLWNLCAAALASTRPQEQP